MRQGRMGRGGSMCPDTQVRKGLVRGEARANPDAKDPLAKAFELGPGAEERTLKDFEQLGEIIRRGFGGEQDRGHRNS